MQALVHKDTDYFFIFDGGDRTPFASRLCPGEKQPVEVAHAADWRGQLGQSQQWLARLKREVSTIDRWALLKKEQSFDVAVDVQPNDDFSDAEAAVMRNALNEIRRYLVEVIQLGKEQSEDIGRRLDYVEGALNRLKKRDWLHIAHDVLQKIGVKLVADFAVEKVQEFWAFASSRIMDALTGLTKLLE